MTLTRRQAIRFMAGAAGCGLLVPAGTFADGLARASAEQVFTVSSVTAAPGPDGAAKRGGMILVNGSLPGPMLRVREGEDVVVRVVNAMRDPTTIHWHGMNQKGTWWMDGVADISQEPIAPGSSFTYRFKADPGGTHLWHSHFGVQYGEGMQGMLIVDEAVNPYNGDYDDERLFLVQDWFHEPGEEILKKLVQPMGSMPKSMGKTMSMKMEMGKPDVGDVPFTSALINGKGRFGEARTPLEVFRVRQGDRIRLRMANLGSTYAMRVRIDGHRMTVIASDGIFTAPREVDSLVIGIGERYDVIVEMNQPSGNYWVRANTLEEGVDHGVRAVLRYKGAPEAEPAPSPAEWGDSLDVMALRPRYPARAGKPDLIARHVLGGSMSPYRWTWDGVPFAMPEHSFAVAPDQSGPGLNMLASPDGKVMRLVMDNPTGMSHPFHMHGRHFHVLGVSEANAGPYKERPLNTEAPVLKDTVCVPPGGWTVIQWKEDNPGFWFFHCHIEWHMATGMAVVVKSGTPPRPPERM